MAFGRMIRTLLLLTLLAGLLSVHGCRTEGPTVERVEIGGEVFTLELALDEYSRAQGLMWRESLAEDGGMLFVYPEPQVMNFWMGNCLIDLDIMYLDPRGFVVQTHTMSAEPPQREDESDTDYRNRMPTYSSRLPAQYAIELRAGTLDRLGISVRDRIVLDFDRLKRLAQ